MSAPATLEPGIGAAIDGHGLRMVVQPIVELGSMQPVGYEALARFELEPALTPDRWFAAAASIGRGVELELAAVDRALALMPDLPAGSYLSLNASPAAILADGMHDRLAAFDAADRLVVEITENIPVEDYEALADALRPHRARGLALAIDDTGAGYASLRHILRLDPDVIKLDRSLTRTIDRERSARALAASLCLFAHETGMSVVAEGIETSSQLVTMQALGAAAGQGYLLGRPAALAPRAAAA